MLIEYQIAISMSIFLCHVFFICNFLLRVSHFIAITYEFIIAHIKLISRVFRHLI